MSNILYKFTKIIKLIFLRRIWLTLSDIIYRIYKNVKYVKKMYTFSVTNNSNVYVIYVKMSGHCVK